MDHTVAVPQNSPNVIDRISLICGMLSGWLLLIISLSIGYEVLSRALFGQATVWVYDMTTYFLVWFSFLSCAVVLRAGRHLNVDIFIGAVPPLVARGLEAAGLLIVATVLTLIFLYTGEATIHAYKTGELEPTIIRTPVYLIHVGMVVGLGVAALQSGREFVRAALACRAHWLAEARSAGSEGQRAPWILAVSLAVFVGLVACGLLLLPTDYAVLGLVVLIIAQLFFGVPVFASLSFAGIAGLYFIFGPQTGLPQAAQIAYKAVLSNTLLAIPLYVLAGSILEAGRIGPELFNFASAWIGHRRGGYAVATVLACGIFAAISGSSVATAATIGSLAIPEMLKRGYEPRFVYGLVAAGGTLGILIPPSTPLILYSGMTDESTGALFMGGVVPGMLLLLGFSLYAVVACGGRREERTDWPTRIAVSKTAFWGIMAPVIVLTGIYSGIFTPTEAAAVVVLYALAVSLVRGTVKWSDLPRILAEGVQTSGMIMMIIVGAMLLGIITTVLQIPQALQEAVADAGLGPWTVFAGLVVIYVFLGMFLEVVSILLITLPIVYPLIVSLGFNGLWFAIALVILMELALITPPVGLNLFTVQGVSGATLTDVIRGVTPFILVLVLGFAFVVAVPQLALWLPSSMGFGH
ncbi:TRAP transporter large permease subunit [Oleispirillum naphthae]|uniref:TRAP transporter large permease subunit n=1 Tax=Oleispirillum naphthae TaxID=2838853 RepID=UPI0030824768